MTIAGSATYSSVLERTPSPRPLYMPLEIGFIETVNIREVWPTENAAFTPWLQSHIGELDKVLGLGLSNPQREVGAGDFSIDLVAETNFGDVVIENQFGRSDHRHLGQLVTYFSHREVQRAIWIVEEARTEHVKAVETLNDRGVGPDDHGVDPAGVDVQVTDGAVADIHAAPRQAVLEVRARFQMVAPAPAPEAAGDGASLDVDGLHVHAVPAQLVRDPGHSGAPGADGNVGWKPGHGWIPTGPRA